MFFPNDLPVNKFIFVNRQRHFKSAKIILKYKRLATIFHVLCISPLTSAEEYTMV